MIDRIDKPLLEHSAASSSSSSGALLYSRNFLSLDYLLQQLQVASFSASSQRASCWSSSSAHRSVDPVGGDTGGMMSTAPPVTAGWPARSPSVRHRLRPRDGLINGIGVAYLRVP